MVVITDGGDTVSKTSYQEAVREAQQAEVILYSIIIVPIENSAGRRYVDAYLWVGRPWLYRSSQPFVMRRALDLVHSTPWR